MDAINSAPGSMFTIKTNKKMKQLRIVDITLQGSME